METSILEQFRKMSKSIKGKLKLEVILTVILLALALGLSLEHTVVHLFETAYLREYSAHGDAANFAIKACVFFSFLSLSLILFPPIYYKRKKKSSEKSNTTAKPSLTGSKDVIKDEKESHKQDKLPH
jgi:hypothetical protein